MEKITHEFMMQLTANMPMKQIDIESEIPQTQTNVNLAKVTIRKPYLQRYYAGTFSEGSDLWFHRFLSNDSERHLHSHPFNFDTTMLCGWYEEEYLNNNKEKSLRKIVPQEQNKFNLFWYVKNFESILKCCVSDFSTHAAPRKISVFDWHRIAAVEPNTWTMMIVKPDRLPFWFFKDDNGETVSMKASPKEWWHDFEPR